ncbi:MAG: helix-turn-helix transcriptional regulator [Leptospirales bacterium]
MVVDLDGLGHRMLEFRKSIGYSQKVIAEKTGIGRSFISHIEAGSQRPSFEVINKLLNSSKQRRSIVNNLQLQIILFCHATVN